MEINWNNWEESPPNEAKSLRLSLTVSPESASPGWVIEARDYHVMQNQISPQGNLRAQIG